MWAVAFSLYFACKLFTLRNLPQDARICETRKYFLGWPGMDPQKFLRNGVRGKADPTLPVLALRNIAIGGICLWGLAPRYVETYPLLAGWLGMTGFIYLLHFGLFHGLAYVWQRRGYGAEPLMNRPIEARKVAELWGRRWNRAFQWLTWRYVFSPLRKRIPAAAAVWICFLLSGLIHELVITAPAGGGYGGPTAYFLLQGLGVMVERHLPLRRRPWLGHLWTLCVVLLPAGLLFPPVFIHNVILPMFTDWGIF
jgi:hypothetical protein